MVKRQQTVKAGARELTLSNLDKVFYPGSGFTKGEVIGFYDAIAEVILPHLRDRPLTMKRFPEGIAGEHFYEKNAPKHTPSWVKTFPIPREEGGSDINYILCNDRATLLWATNLADIEKHVLLARVPEVNHPTSIVFDLDPGEPAGILDCAEIALHLKKLFAAWGLQVFVKVSGSKGLHLSVPLNGDAPYEVTQPFAKTVAELVAHELPKRVVSGMAKSIRAGKVFIDWSQNSDFKTTVCVYSMRAKGAEPLISMPVTWDELARAIKRKDAKHLSFTPAAAIKRIEKVGDLFAPVLKLKQRVPAAFTKALASGPTPKLSRWPRNIKTNERDKSLREYRAKRDLTRTPEPAAPVLPNESKRKGPHRFVIQKHAASHLHYDWRLEMQGVLRSWAVPKGPPTQLKDARLAMHVEDHPLDYEKFEGTIPPGNYGAGTVMVWDYGVYQDITGNDAAAFHSGKMHIVMSGQKLKGEWILVKDKREPESNRWLLIKAGESMKPLSAKMDDTSAISRRSMAAIAKDNDAQWQSNRPAAMARRKMRLTSRQTTPPKFIEPMKCKPVTSLPNESNWTFEIKFDGYRCLALKNDDEVKLVSRNEKLLNARFPNVVRALAEVPGDFAIDGEIVALDEEGRPSFQILQNNVSKAYDAYFYAFDLLNRNGEELLRLPIEERRAFLDELLPEPNDPLRRSPLLDAPSGQVLEAVRKLGLEGVVGKRNGSLYQPGERSGAWIKQRTSAEQEFVIGGYKPGTRGFDSLLVGVYENKYLIFVAQVKDGFVPRLRDEIFAQFKKLRTGVCPFVNLPEKKGARRGDALTAEKMKECRWLKPKLVCQVAFVEWTHADNLRHAKFIAMRDDKKASEVVRES
ncbi:MAG: non-homologous end-joining DNA ligase [Chthoniobacterales bacterium]